MPLTAQEESQLSANRLSNATNVYAIGLDTGVVSFFSQQCRAFDLARVFAKKVGIAFFDKHKIGIIGGGVGGTTLWAALQAYGFKDVTLYEASDEILARQASASHRHAHPAINDWPLFDAMREFSSTTKWPFLNWFGTDAASVVRQMRDDPYIKELRFATPERVKLRHIATIISEDKTPGATDLPPVTVSFQTQEGNVSDYFETVFLAVGYDYEVNLNQSASNSYWWPDNVREYLWDRHGFVGHKFLMSGTGDGGLIDLVRLAEKPNLEGKHSNVSMEVVAHLRNVSYQKLDNNWEPGLSRPEKLLAESIKTEMLDQHMVERIFHKLFIDESFKKYFAEDSDLERITLLARDGNFLQGRASPVNKVLVAYLVKRFPDLVKKGLVSASGRPSYMKEDESAGEPLHTEEDFRKVVVFTRHGAKSRADSIVGIDKLGGTKRRTCTATGDEVNYDIGDVFDSLRASHGRSVRVAEWAHIEILVAQYLDTFFDQASFTFSGNKDAAKIDIHLPLTEENKSAYRRLGGFDKELFGIDVVYNGAERLDLTTDTMESFCV